MEPDRSLESAEYSAQIPQVVEHFFRHETGRLHGALTRLLGPENLSLVEDVAQGALLQAMRAWSIGGIPPNPSAWITRVAMNQARDLLRHRQMSHSKETNIITHFEQTHSGASPAVDESHEIRDDALRLMFVCCHPQLSIDAQVVTVKEHLAGLNAMHRGEVDAYAGDQTVLIGLNIAVGEQMPMKLSEQNYSYEPYGLVLRRNDAEFKQVVNQTLARLYRTGEIVEVYDRWFGKLGKPSPLLVTMYALNGLPE